MQYRAIIDSDVLSLNYISANRYNATQPNTQYNTQYITIHKTSYIISKSPSKVANDMSLRVTGGVDGTDSSSRARKYFFIAPPGRHIVCVYVCVRSYVCMCARVYVYVFVRVRIYACVSVSV